MSIQSIALRMQQKTLHARLGDDRKMCRETFKAQSSGYRISRRVTAERYDGTKKGEEEFKALALALFDRFDYVVRDAVDAHQMKQTMKSTIKPVTRRLGISAKDQIEFNLKYGG